MAQFILQNTQDVALDRENKSKRSRSVRVPSQQTLNLYPSPLIQADYLEGMMKKKKHWDEPGIFLLVPIPSPALTERELMLSDQ